MKIIDSANQISDSSALIRRNDLFDVWFMKIAIGKTLKSRNRSFRN